MDCSSTQNKLIITALGGFDSNQCFSHPLQYYLSSLRAVSDKPWGHDGGMVNMLKQGLPVWKTLCCNQKWWSDC